MHICTHVTVKVLVKVNRSHRGWWPFLFDVLQVGRFGGQQIVVAAPVTRVTSVVLEFAGRCCTGTAVIGERVVLQQVVVGRRGQVTRGIDNSVIVAVARGRHRGRSGGHAVIDPSRHVPVAFLLLHPPVLEPYLYLPFREVQLGRHLLSLAPHDVLGRPEHRLQHGRLVLGVRLPGPLAA